MNPALLTILDIHSLVCKMRNTSFGTTTWFNIIHLHQSCLLEVGKGNRLGNLPFNFTQLTCALIFKKRRGQSEKIENLLQQRRNVLEPKNVSNLWTGFIVGLLKESQNSCKPTIKKKVYIEPGGTIAGKFFLHFSYWIILSSMTILIACNL